MSTVKENITNALTWFYDRLKTKHLDPIEESIEENKNVIDTLNASLTYTNGEGSIASNMASVEMLKYYKYGRVCTIYFIAVVGSSAISASGVTIASGFPKAVASQHGVGRFADGSVVMLRITTGGNVVTGYGGSLQAGGTLRAFITYITDS